MPAEPSTIASVDRSLREGRTDVDRLLSEASGDFRRLTASSAARAQHEARRRLGEIELVGVEIEAQIEALEVASARFAEAAAAACARLVELSAATDFAPHPFQDGLRSTVRRRREATR